MPDDAVKKIATAFRASQDVDRLVRIVTAAPTEHRDIQTILDKLAGLDTEAARLDAELKSIFAGSGYRR